MFGDFGQHPRICLITSREYRASRERKRTLVIATYMATDPEGESVTLSLMGNDAGLFELAADTAVEGEVANDVSQVLSFKKSPDFEMPGDRNHGQRIRSDGAGLGRHAERRPDGGRQG